MSFTLSEFMVTPATDEDPTWVPYTRNKNLFDINKLKKKDGYLLNDDGVETTTQYSGYTLNSIAVNPNTTYTLSGKFALIGGNYRIYFFDENDEWISRTSSLTVE